MATPEQRARRRAQRATAKAVKERRRQLPPNVSRKARETFYGHAHDILNSQSPEPAPDKNNSESRALASLASYAFRGKAPEEFAAFKNHFYHKRAIEEEEE
jgi:hypothetical protein